jgi:hypothetical protein
MMLVNFSRSFSIRIQQRPGPYRAFLFEVRRCQSSPQIERFLGWKPAMMLITGSVNGADPATVLPLALAGPDDQHRDSANQDQPNYRHEDHSSILLSASSKGPGLIPGLSCLKPKFFAQEPVSSLSGES